MLLHLCMIHCAFWYDYVTSHVNSLQLIIQIFANVCAPFFLHSTYMYYIFIYVVYLYVCVCVCVPILISINIILVTNFIMHSSMVFIRNLKTYTRIHKRFSLHMNVCVYALHVRIYILFL